MIIQISSQTNCKQIMLTQKKYDWKDSNLALFGSDTEKTVKKDSAKTEKAWIGAGQKIGLEIWRIVQFKVVSWPKDQYGQFYDGDSYIILNTYTENPSNELLYDVHFWIGQYSTQDEYATAAYKTVELDILLDDKPVQHREVMNYESQLFKSYFKRIELLEGGAESGFRHVGPVEYKARLLHFHGLKKRIEVKQRPLKKACIDNTDVFILDLGTKLYQWNGMGANKDERFKAAQYLATIKSKRGTCRTEVLDEFNTPKNHEFYVTLSDDPLALEEVEELDDVDFEPCLFRLSDATGVMEFTLISKGSIDKELLDPMDVFIADTGKTCFTWIGSKASKDEMRNAMSYSHKYLQSTSHPLIPVSCFNEGRESQEFLAVLARNKTQ